VTLRLSHSADEGMDARASYAARCDRRTTMPSHRRAANVINQARDRDDGELRRLHSEADALKRDMHDPDDREHLNESLIARLRREVELRKADLGALRVRLDAAEHELEDLRAIRDALTPPELPERPGLELAAEFPPASAERVSGDFSLVGEGPQDSTVLVVGDVVGQLTGRLERELGPRHPTAGHRCRTWATAEAKAPASLPSKGRTVASAPRTQLLTGTTDAVLAADAFVTVSRTVSRTQQN
jgi:hypothetical protein